MVPRFSSLLTAAVISGIMALPVLSNALEFELLIGAPKTAPLEIPFCIDFDQAGNLYGVEFENGHRVFQFNEKGDELTFLGGKLGVIAPKDNNGFGDGGPISAALFSGMHDLAVTKAGLVYIADSWAGRMRVYDPKTGIIKTIAGTGKKADSGDGGPAIDADIRQTFACALSPDETRLYVVDIASNRVRYVDLNTGLIHAFAGNGIKGKPQEKGLAVNEPLFNPRAVAVDPRDGRVYIVDRDAHTLLMVDAEGRLHTVVNQTNKQGASGDNSPALEATMNGPKHACVDHQGRVIIADAENHLIRRFDPATGKIETLAGKPTVKGDDLTAEGVLLNRPHGVRISRDGKTLYVVDSYNNRVLRAAYE